MISSSIFGLTTPQLLLSLLALSFTYVLALILYRIFFHPLSKFPGPILGKFTDYHTWESIVRQNRTYMQHDLIRKHGSPVRVSTNELIFADAKSWTDIYGQSSNPCLKDPAFYNALSVTGAVNVLNAVHRSQHARIRRLLSHSFALQTVLQSQDMIAARVDGFVGYVFGNAARSDSAVDIYNAIHEHYLDIISELCFGQSFECLRENGSQRFHDVDNFLNVVPPTAFFPGIKYLPVKWLQEGFAGLNRLEEFSRAAVEEFVSAVEKGKGPVEKGNFLGSLVRAVDDETGSKLTVDELVENAIIFLVAGSGTTAVSTTYTLWECGRNPDVHEKLVREIRSAFPDRPVVPTWDEASKLPYLNAVIEEILRLWGPINVSCPRVSPGRILGDVFVPQGTVVSALPYATARDPKVFSDPDRFYPERWLNATTEMKNMSRPFSTGPRNCIGRHLAEVQLTLSLARIYQLYDVATNPIMTPDKMVLKDRGVMEPWDASLVVKVSEAK